MPQPIPLPKHSPWVTQVLVINALLQREIATRFGEYRLGFFWMLFEPLVSVIIIGMVIGSIAGRTVPEIPYAFFLLSGKLYLKLFVNPMNSGIDAISANQGLLVYPSVKPLDTFVARFVYELITIFFSFTVFCIVGALMGVPISLANLDLLMASYLIMWLMGCGCGLISGVAAAHFKEMEKILRVIQSPLVFISAVLVPVSAFPAGVQQLLLMNPLVHPIEVSRQALFPHYHVAGTNLLYPSVFAIILLATGLTLFQGSRNFMSQR